MTALVLSLALAGAPVQFCVGSAYGNVAGCAARLEDLPAGSGTSADHLFAVDAVGNVADWGLYCSWHGVRVAAARGDLSIAACDEALRRLDDAADALTRAGLVQRDEWARVRASAVRGVVLYPARVLEVPRGEELVEGVYVPATAMIHLTGSMEAAPHELFHAVLQSRGGSIGHEQFNKLVDFVQGAFATKYRRRPVL